MLKALLLFLCAMLGDAPVVLADAGKLAFEHGDAVWVARIDGTQAKKIADGAAPELSPDGKRLAFHTQQAIGQPRIAKSPSPISPPVRSRFSRISQAKTVSNRDGRPTGRSCYFISTWPTRCASE